MDFLLTVVLPAALAALLATLCDRRWPRASSFRLTALVTLLVALIVVVLASGLGIFFVSGDCSPTLENPCHIGAMAAGAIMMIGLTASLFSLILVPPITYFVLFVLRRP